ncbi:MAG: hypothetical protein NTZ19_08330 [Bacteroidetes bacterium]|nr:hypothetical protein [Bacteroidota bacterium]
MNLVNRFFLWIVLLPTHLYEKMGINTTQLRAVLNTKLMMDDRRPNTFHQTQQKKNKKPVSFATLGTMLVTGFMGCFFLASFFVGKDMVTHLTIYFSFFLFVLASTLIADFTSVLIDIRDNVIIIPKPISDKTFVLARLLHVLIHISKLVIPMVLPTLIYLGIKQNVLVLIPFGFIIALATLFTIFLINALYILILKLTTPERFKTIISYFQIFFAIAFYGGYQIVPKLINKVAMEQYDINTNIWIWLAPPYWFAGAWQFLTSFEFTIPLVSSFILSLVVPIASIWVVIKYFAPSFNQKLSMISGSESGPAPKVQEAGKKTSTNSGYLTFLSKLFAEKGAETMSFQHVWKITARSRDYKMKVYPSLGYLVVYLVMMFLNNRNFSLADVQNQNGTGKIVFISLIYFSSLIMIMSVNQLLYSEKYKAAWFFFTTPIEKPGRIISGALKSMIAKFFFPLVTVTFVAAVVIVGPKIIPNLLLGIFNEFLIIFTIAYISFRQFPFAQPQNSAAKSNFIRGLVSMIIPATIGGLHYLIYNMMPVVIILAVLSGIAAWMIMDGIKNRTWEILKLEYKD